MTDRVDDFLTAIRVDDIRVTRLRYALERCEQETTLKGIAYDREKVQTSPEDPMVMLAERRERAYDDLMQAIEQRNIDRAKVAKAFEHLDKIHCEIMTAYYLSGTPMEAIAGVLHYSVSSVYTGAAGILKDSKNSKTRWHILISCHSTEGMDRMPSPHRR